MTGENRKGQIGSGRPRGIFVVLNSCGEKIGMAVLFHISDKPAERIFPVRFAGSGFSVNAVLAVCVQENAFFYGGDMFGRKSKIVVIKFFQHFNLFDWGYTESGIHPIGCYIPADDLAAVAGFLNKVFYGR